MKKFRVKNLTVAVDSADLQKCGKFFSNPVCVFTAGCGVTFCDGITVHCLTGSVNCGPKLTLHCGISRDCLISRGGCGLNYSTLPPTEFTNLIKVREDITEKLELIEVLQADLNVAIKQLDESKAELTEVAMPNTLAEAKEVKSQIEGALKEVNARIEKLK